MAESRDAHRFTSQLFLRCPDELPAAVKVAARKQCTTPSDYVRRSIFERLKADGIDPAQLAGAA